MSLRERLLATVDSFFLTAISSGEINDAFSVDFGSLLNALEEGRRTGTLSSEDGKLAFEVSKTIEELASGLQRLEEVSLESGKALESRVEQELIDSNDCDVPLSQQPASLSSSPSTTACSSPSSKSSTTTSGASKPSLDSPSDLSPAAELSSDSNTVFAPLRDWFLEHMSSPFPTKLEKKTLVLQKGLTLNSINLWFTNMRRRSGWTEAQHTFASSNLSKFKSLVEQFNDPSSVPANTPPLTPEFITEIERLTTYVNDRGNGRVRSFVLKVLQDGIHATKHIPDDDFEDLDGSSEDEDDDSRVSTGGRTKVEEEAEEENGIPEGKFSEVCYKKKGSWEGERAGERRGGGGRAGTRAISPLPLSDLARRYSFESSSTDSSYTGSGPPTPIAYSDHHYRRVSFSSDSIGDSHSSSGSSSPYPFFSQQTQYSPHPYYSNSSYYPSNPSSPVAGSHTLDTSFSHRHSSAMACSSSLDGYHQEDPSRRSSLPWSFRRGRGEERDVVEGSIDFSHFQHRQHAPPSHRPFVPAPSSSYHNTVFHPSYEVRGNHLSSTTYYPHLAGDPSLPSPHHFQSPPTLHLQRHRLDPQRDSSLRYSSPNPTLIRRNSMSPLATNFSANKGTFVGGSRKRRSSAVAGLEGGAKRARSGATGTIGERSVEAKGRVEWVSRGVA